LTRVLGTLYWVRWLRTCVEIANVREIISSSKTHYRNHEIDVDVKCSWLCTDDNNVHPAQDMFLPFTLIPLYRPRWPLPRYLTAFLGTPGVLVIKKSCLPDTPTVPGGGIVTFVSNEEHRCVTITVIITATVMLHQLMRVLCTQTLLWLLTAHYKPPFAPITYFHRLLFPPRRYLPPSAEREESGTPNILGDIRLGLAMKIKESFGNHFLYTLSFLLKSFLLLRCYSTFELPWWCHAAVRLLSLPTIFDINVSRCTQFWAYSPCILKRYSASASLSLCLNLKYR
jgi:hypothetical protein